MLKIKVSVVIVMLKNYICDYYVILANQNNLKFMSCPKEDPSQLYKNNY
jgi:hypothetical protein